MPRHACGTHKYRNDQNKTRQYVGAVRALLLATASSHPGQLGMALIDVCDHLAFERLDPLNVCTA
jgi:hypothetical protein